MIHKLDDGSGFVVSKARYGWLPGIYADERAARYAFRFTDTELVEIGGWPGPRPPVTFEEMQMFRRAQATGDDPR
jgi:hypothetical protein